MEYFVMFGAMTMDITTLISDLGARNTETYYAARDQLRVLGTAAIPALVKTMLAGNDILSWRAAALLAEIKVSALLDHFVQALESPSPMVRQITAQVIGEHGDKRCIPQLLNHLHDNSCLVQMWVVEALGVLGDGTIVEPLLDLLQQTDSHSIQLSVIKALGQIGDANAAEGLRPFFHSDEHHVRSRARRVYNQLLGSSQED